MPEVEFAIAGAGALGSIIGAHLARAGHSVLMLVRERRAQQIAQHGLSIKGLVEFSQAVPTLTEASRLAGAAVLIVATKTYGTEALVASLRGADIGVAFSIQNGLMKDDVLAAAFGRQRVLGSLADVSGELLASGEVLFTRNSNLFVGELDGSDSIRARDIAASIDGAGVRTRADPDILSLEWSKFAAWAAMMALSVTTRALTWKYLIDPATAQVLVSVVREVGVLAGAFRVRLSRPGGAAGGEHLPRVGPGRDRVAGEIRSRHEIRGAAAPHVDTPGPGSRPAAGSRRDPGLCGAQSGRAQAGVAIVECLLQSGGRHRPDSQPADVITSAATIVPL